MLCIFILLFVNIKWSVKHQYDYILFVNIIFIFKTCTIIIMYIMLCIYYISQQN